MSRRTHLVWYCAALLTAGLAGSLQVQASEDTPQLVTFASQAPGGAAYAASVALGSVVTQNAPYRVEVSGNTGSSAVADLVDSGDAHFGFLTSFDQHMAYTGQAPYRRSYENLRLVMLGTSWRIGAIVPTDSSIQSIADLRGKRVAGGYNAHPVCQSMATAILANGGLTWDDVRLVPVPDAVQGVRALQENRVDASVCALPIMSQVREADARIGIRFLPADDSAEAMARTHEHVSILTPQLEKAGSMVGVVEDLQVLTYQAGVVASVQTPDSVVKTFLSAVWDNGDELAAAHPLFKEWTHDAMVGQTQPIPHHPGAIAFFTEKDRWTQEMETENARFR